MTPAQRNHAIDRCHLVLEAVENNIRTMPDSFLGNDTWPVVEMSLAEVKRRALEEWVEGMPRPTATVPDGFVERTDLPH